MKQASRRVIWRDGWADRRAARSRPSEPGVEIGGAICDAYWRLDDPLPGLAHHRNELAMLIRSTLRRVSAFAEQLS
jgi:hypothetical protein